MDIDATTAFGSPQAGGAGAAGGGTTAGGIGPAAIVTVELGAAAGSSAGDAQPTSSDAAASTPVNALGTVVRVTIGPDTSASM